MRWLRCSGTAQSQGLAGSEAKAIPEPSDSKARVADHTDPQRMSGTPFSDISLSGLILGRIPYSTLSQPPSSRGPLLGLAAGSYQ